MAETICRTIGANIRKRRNAKKWTLAHLAASLGVSYQQIQKYEKGTNRLPCDMLVQLAEIFACPVDELCREPSSTVSEEDRFNPINRIASKELRHAMTALLDVLTELAHKPAT